VATTIVASAQRKIDEAIRIFESQAPDQPKPDIAELQRLVMAGQYSEVETLVDKLGPDLTEDIRDILYLAYIGHGLDLTEKALNAEAQEKDSLFTQATNVLEKAMDLKPTASPAIGNLASILTTQAVSAKTVKATGLLQRATSLFEQACKLNPRDSDLVTNWGAAIALQASISPWASQMPRQEAAIEKFARAVELNGENARALTLWGEMLRRQSDHFNGPEGERLVSEAIAKFEQAWALGSRSPGLLTNWATAESTIGFGGGLASHLTNWAMALQRRRDHVRGPEGDAVLAEAISKFRLALKYKPNDVSALVGLSRSLAASTPLRPDGDSAQLSEAESLLKHALSQPASPFCTPSRIHAELAQVLTRRVISQQPQQFPDAMAESLEECVEATRLDPLSPYAWCVFGMTYATIAHYVTIDKRRYLDEAIRKWNRALEIDSNDYLTLANLGMALNWLSKDEPDRRQLLERSEKVFRHLLSTQKNNYFAINQLGHTVFELALLAESEADFSGRIADARTHLIKAAELRPSDPAPLVTLGYLYLETANRVPAKRAKSLEEAKKVLDSANAIQLGIGSYNLACWAAMQSDESECQRYLEESRDNKQLPPRNTIIADRDFKRYAESPWFVKFISSLDH
jgi:tetratricopeptide (TPR) repeat protein